MALLAPDHIAVVNVRPAYDASLAAGMSVQALHELGLPESTLNDPEGVVPGCATYAHFDAMFQRSDYAEFVADAVARHTFGTLGVVGLACKTLDTVAEALLCHQRFQHLTNQTTRYQPVVHGPHLLFRDERWGPPTEGLLRVSEYTTLVAMQLLRLATGEPHPAVALHTRSTHMSRSLRERVESLLGAPVKTGCARTELVLDAAVLEAPVQSADAELAAYFTQKLRRASHLEPTEPEIVQRVRIAIQYCLATGRPTADRVARRLAMSARTLQRHLRQHDFRFDEVLEQTRLRLAEGYLADPSLTLAEVAYLCGYEEQSSFFRAFRKWSGTTPLARRQQLIDPSA